MTTRVEGIGAEAEKLRARQFEQKQEWKKEPGNRYTPEELKLMLEGSPQLTIHHRRTKIMYLC